MSFRSSKRKGNARKRWKPNWKEKSLTEQASRKLPLKNLTHALLNMTVCCCTFCLRLSIISNPLWGFSNHKRYPKILSGLLSLPIDPLRSLLLRFEICSGYTIHILYYAGVFIMPPRVLVQRPKPCGGNYSECDVVRHQLNIRLNFSASKRRYHVVI